MKKSTRARLISIMALVLVISVGFLVAKAAGATAQSDDPITDDFAPRRLPARESY